MVIHRVVQGDTLGSIAQRYGSTVEELIYQNQLKYPDRLVIGQEIVVDTDDIPHKIVQGDTLYKLSKFYNVSVDSILQNNPTIDANNLQIGSIIYIPINTEAKREIKVNGYAVIPIDKQVVERTSPYLTFISPFSYKVLPDGGLVPLDDTMVLDVSKPYGVAPLLTITNIEEGATFSSSLANTILTNLDVQETLINNIIQVLDTKGYDGVNIDFEYLYPKDRDNYNAFLQNVVDRLRPLGYIVSVALAPKVSEDQSGLLYEAHDYKTIGSIVDYVILMTYEWGYLYGPPLAVSPILPVSEVIEYATSVMDSKKILMGMPNYGYDWTLPYVSGTAAEVLTNTEAVNRAIEYNTSIEYDTVSQAPYYYYTDENGNRHVVWFDNASSTYARLMLVNKYNLAGVSYWNINNYFSQNWLVLNDLFEIEKI